MERLIAKSFIFLAFVFLFIGIFLEIHKAFGFCDEKNIEIKVRFEKTQDDEYEARAACEVKLYWSDHRKEFPEILKKTANDCGVKTGKITMISNDTFKFRVLAKSKDDVYNLEKNLKAYFK